MKKVFKIFLLVVMMVPAIIFADSYSTATAKANNFIKGNDFKNSYEKYIDTNTASYYSVPNIFKSGGLISQQEFLITANEKGNKFSYLYDGQKFWTLTSNSSEHRYVVNYEDMNASETTSNIGTRVTEYAHSYAQVTGSGTFTNPWVFVPEYKVVLKVNDSTKGSISNVPCGTSNEIKLSITARKDSVREIYICPRDGNRYVDNDCGSILSDSNALSRGIVTLKNVTRDITCNINFGISTYTISLDQTNFDALSIPEKIYVAYDVGWFANKSGTIKISELVAIPKRGGYSFLGYYKDATYAKRIISDTGVIEANTNKEFTVSTTLASKWAANSYQISYNNNGGTGSMANTSHVYDSTPLQKLRANTFTKVGYTFQGWDTSDNGVSIIYGNNAEVNIPTEPNEIVPLHAVWEANQYTVVYDKNSANATGNTASSSHIYDTSKTLTKNGYSRTGYTYQGWSDTSTATTATYSNEQSVKNLTSAPNGTKTLYAVWKAHTYTVNYNNICTMSSTTHTYDVTQSLKQNPCTRTGYTFQGWSKTDGGAVEYTNMQNVKNLTSIDGGTITLYAVWKINTYTVAYNNTCTMSPTTYTYGVAKALRTNSCTKSGYTFQGWSTSSAATTVTYSNGQSVSNLTTTNGGTVTLYAVWKANTYTVYYSNICAMSSTTHTYGVAKALRSNSCSKLGYTFQGWSTSSTATTATYSNGQSVSNLTTTNGGKVTLYAVWKVNTYTVAYNNTCTMSSTTHTYGVAKSLRSNSCTKSGYTFQGWSTSSAATAVTYSNGQSVSNLTTTNGGKVTLYAVWKANTYTVVYNNTCAMSSTTHTYGVAKALRTNSCTKSGYAFLGWSTSSSATTATYSNGQSVSNLTTINGRVVTLYAVWLYVPPVYTVYLDKTGGTGGTSNIYEKYEIGIYKDYSCITKMTTGSNPLSVPSMTGYTFNGYYTQSNGAGTQLINKNGYITSQYTPYKGSITLYAYWTRSTFTDTFYVNDKLVSSLNVAYGDAIVPNFNPNSYITDPNGYYFGGFTPNISTQPNYSVRFDLLIYEDLCWGQFGNQSLTNINKQKELLSSLVNSLGISSKCAVTPHDSYSYSYLCTGVPYSKMKSLYDKGWDYLPRYGSGYSIYKTMGCNRGYSTEKGR